MVSYDKLTPELLAALQSMYPKGYANHLQRMDAPTPFYYLLLELEDTKYLVKINIQEVLKAQEEDDDDDGDMDDLEEEFRDESYYYPDGE